MADVKACDGFDSRSIGSKKPHPTLTPAEYTFVYTYPVGDYDSSVTLDYCRECFSQLMEQLRTGAMKSGYTYGFKRV